MAENTTEESSAVSEMTNNEDVQRLENDIKKEISKLRFYLEQTDELVTSNDYEEMGIVDQRTTKINEKLSELISRTQELKIELDSTPRSVRQWKKEVKMSYASLIEEKEKITKALQHRQREINEAEGRRVMETEERQRRKAEQERNEDRARQEQQEEYTRQRRLEQERIIWQEKLEAEIRATEKKLEMENQAKSTTAKLPKLKISPFNGTAVDWIRFENMFTSQVAKKPISDEEKFGYLLEMVNTKVREKISNLKPSTSGYNTAWERLKKEYGHTALVVNAHMDGIINLQVVKGSNYERVKEFYEKVSRNFDALQTLGEADMLRGFVMSTLNKLPHVKADLVRTDDSWETWSMKDLLESLQKWLRRNKVIDEVKTGHDGFKRERQWFSQKGKERAAPKEKKCIFCEGNHWPDCCKVHDTREKRKALFVTRKLCFNCGIAGHRGSNCKSRGCFKCQGRHHTSLCDREQDNDAVLTGYSPSDGEGSLPPIIPVKVKGQTLWAYLDTGSGRNFISSEAMKKMKLNPVRHEVRQIVTVNGTKKQSLPIFQVDIESIDGKQVETSEVTGSRLHNFTTMRRPDMNELKKRYEHTKDKQFYMKVDNKYQIDLIIGDSLYSKIKTEEVFKGKEGEPIVEGTTFGWIVHGGDYPSDECMFAKEVSDYERLYNLDVLGIEDRSEADQQEVYTEFVENIERKHDGRYEVNIPWIQGSCLAETNLEPSKKRLVNIERKLRQDKELQKEYQATIEEQLESGIIEKVPTTQTGKRIFYMPHKPVVRKDATTTKIRMVFDASAKPHPLTSSVNECMHTGPPLQPRLWDILTRARMSTNLLLADIQKAFHQIGIKEEDRDAFRFLFNINNKQEHFRFARVPFGAEASPFILGATLQYHYSQQPPEYDETVEALKDNTYVDNLMKASNDVKELEKFKVEATKIMEDAKFTLHKWESNIQALDGSEMPNPGKILGYRWDKREDTLEVQVPIFPESQPVTKKTVLSQLGSIYDPLGILSPTLAEGKHIYRETCDEKKGWNEEVTPTLKRKWFKWTERLKNVRVPRSIVTECGRTKAIHLHQFADASNLACCTVTIAVVESDTRTVKGILTSKSRISKRNTSIARLELISGHMAANMVKNLCQALKHMWISSVTVWMDSMVALYWITNPERPWKTFVANRVRKIAETTREIQVNWKYCPTEKNLADLGSRGASIDKMEKKGWFTGPDWIMNEQEWPEQPELKLTPQSKEEQKPFKEVISFTPTAHIDEWDELLARRPYWSTLRATAWALRFVHNSQAKRKRCKKRSGPLQTEEIIAARTHWVRKVQQGIQENLETPGFKLLSDETGILRCHGRIPNYTPTYLEDKIFTEKLIRHVHELNNHLGIAHTMASLREHWWIPHLRRHVKKQIRNCNTCKVYSTKPYGASPTAALPEFRTEVSRPFQNTGVDFAGPLKYKVGKKEGKASILIFTCATSRAVHLELTKSQTAEEFKMKLNAFITRRTRPQRMVSDNAQTFRSTATWIKKIRKDEKVQNFLATQEIRWQFNLSKSPWWGGMYERLIKEVKKTLYKTLGKTHLNFDQLEAVVMDIERHLNNRPLTYVESELGEDRVLTPNTIMWGQDAHTFEGNIGEEEEELRRFAKRFNHARQHAWSRWRREYVHSLMEFHRIRKGQPQLPEVGEIVLILGETKNRGIWMKGKVIRYIKGKDGVVRGVILLHKGNHIERPLQLICPLECRSAGNESDIHGDVEEEIPRVREKRKAAMNAKAKIKLLADIDSD